MTQESETTVERIIIESGGLTANNALFIIQGWVTSVCDPQRIRHKTLDEIRSIQYTNSYIDNNIKMNHLGQMQHQEAIALSIAVLKETWLEMESERINNPEESVEKPSAKDDDCPDEDEPSYSTIPEALVGIIADQEKRPVTAQYILYGMAKAIGIPSEEIAKHASTMFKKPLRPMLDLSAKASWDRYEELRKKKASSATQATQGSRQEHKGEGK